MGGEGANTMNEIAVVTAVTGGYDHVGSHVYNQNVDYIFFTDGATEPLDSQWQVEILPNNITNDPRKLAKIPKLNPHMLESLNNYRYVIWIDGSMQIISSDFVNQILSYMDASGLVLSPHFDGRNCAYGEATIRPPKYQMEDLDGQCNFYRSQGFPENYGLWEAGVEARDMTVSLVKEFGEVWFNEVLTWTIQDQVSLGYSLWKTGLKPAVLDKSWREYNWLHLNAHKREWIKENEWVKD